MVEEGPKSAGKFTHLRRLPLQSDLTTTEFERNFIEILGRPHRDLYRFTIEMAWQLTGGSRQEAEDRALDVLLRLHRNEFDRPVNGRTWIARAMVRIDVDLWQHDDTARRYVGIRAGFDPAAEYDRAEAEALLALLDAELYVDSPPHPDYIARPSSKRSEELGKRAFDQAQAVITAERTATVGVRSDDNRGAAVTTWSSELSLISYAHAELPAVTDGLHPAHRVWEITILDTDFVNAALGSGADGPLSVKVTDRPLPEGSAVTVSVPISTRPRTSIDIVAVIDDGIGTKAPIPLSANSGDPAAQADTIELSGSSVLPAHVSGAHPTLSLSLFTRLT